jgi:hypothetical protein
MHNHRQVLDWPEPRSGFCIEFMGHAERKAMADHKDNVGTQDRVRVAAEQQYEVQYFADRHGISAEEAQKIIVQAGPSREEADSLAMRLKQG